MGFKCENNVVTIATALSVHHKACKAKVRMNVHLAIGYYLLVIIICIVLFSLSAEHYHSIIPMHVHSLDICI